MSLLLGVNLAFFAWTAQRRVRQVFVARGAARFTWRQGELLARVKDTLVYALGQRRMTKYTVAGLAHILIFAGFLVLLLRSLLLWGRGYDVGFDFFGVLGAGTLLGDGYNLAKDIFACLVVLGASVFVWLRVVVRSPRMTLGVEGLVILGIIITMMLADFLYDGAGQVLHARALHQEWAFHAFEPVGSLFALGLKGVEDTGVLKLLWHAGFWWHAALVLIFLNILPYSKHFHIITAFPNVFTRDRSPYGRLPKIDDLEGRVEREEALGIGKLEDLSWQHALDLYTCTECGRCSDHCPAYITDKKLSPKHLTLALRDHLYDTEAALLHGKTPESDERGPLRTHPEPPEDAYFRNETPQALVPHIIDPDVIWACTSCRACEEQCPVLISYVDKIVGMRRDQVLMQNTFPPELAKPFQGMEVNGNPWNLPQVDRDGWAKGLSVPRLVDRPDAEVIYWVGCAASYDDRAQRVARSVVELLGAAGVNYAILGKQECCTGDSARRAGNEYLFQMLAEQNVETLNGLGAQEKTIITACPHCFNTLANEYGDFGGNYKVVNHTDFLFELVREGKLTPVHRVEERITYHDSCYLGRYNNVYDSPRDILKSIPGVTLGEVEKANREQGLCCGAGGAQMWMEEQNNNRVNRKRTLQILQTQPETVASACPFCMTMLTDGIKDAERDQNVKQLDVAEVLARAVLGPVHQEAASAG